MSLGRKNLLIVAAILVMIAGFVLVLYSVNTNDDRNNDMSNDISDTSEMQMNMKITSSVFEEGGDIPSKYTCDAENINPPLSISNVPDNAKSLVLIVDDPDAPMGTWNHLLAWNIDPGTTEIEEGKIPESAVLGKNDFGENEYSGPCPPSGTHRYYFKLYALDTMLDLDSNSGRSELEKAMEGYIVSQASLMGKYSRS